MLVGASVGGVAGYAGGAARRRADARDRLRAGAAGDVRRAGAARRCCRWCSRRRRCSRCSAGIFAVVGAPFVARGVRAIVRSERQLDYASRRASLGASHLRLLVRHLLPAARGFIAVQITLLVPAFIVAEATLSYVGLGFPDPVASWGTMLQDASTTSASFADFPVAAQSGGGDVPGRARA